VTTLRLPAALLSESFAQLRACGASRHECVVYWCAAVDEPDLLTRVVHPVHHAGPAWYEVDSAWVTEFFLQLRHDRQTVRVQVHTHPGPAGHSGTDDQFSLVPATGFLSLVIPRFAAGRIGLQDTHLGRMQPTGTWSRVEPEGVLRVE
jgi:hypothetical protein